MHSRQRRGIPEEYKERIFEKFVQVERKRARLRTGTGLGLTFCKMAIELHDGKYGWKANLKKGARSCLPAHSGKKH